MELLVKELDLSAFMRLNGVFVTQEVDGEDEPPCPACGTAAPLVDGACSDCGLQLA